MVLPGYGPLFKQNGNYKQTVTIPPGGGDWEYVPDHDWWTGLNRFDVESLCAHYGYGVPD